MSKVQQSKRDRAERKLDVRDAHKQADLRRTRTSARKNHKHSAVVCYH